MGIGEICVSRKSSLGWYTLVAGRVCVGLSGTGGKGGDSLVEVELGMVNIMASRACVGARSMEEESLRVKKVERGMLYVVADTVLVGPGGRDGGGLCVEEVERGIVHLVAGHGRGSGQFSCGGSAWYDVRRGNPVGSGGTEEEVLFMEEVERGIVYLAEGRVCVGPGDWSGGGLRRRSRT